MPTCDILIVSSNSERQKRLASVFAVGGYSAQFVNSTAEAIKQMRDGLDAAIALIDQNIGADQQFSTSKELIEQRPGLQVILITSGTKMDLALRASREGVFWLLAEPFENEDLLYLAARGIVVNQLAKQNLALKEALKLPAESNNLIVRSDIMQALMRRIQRIASLDTSVLLTGESGTGKTLLASLIHDNSSRRGAPFVSLSCANFPKDLLESELFGHEKGAFTGASSTKLGSIELCAGGTLFLDEIGEMPLELQPKILTFLQDRKVRRVGSKSSKFVDVRIICATNKDLKEAVNDGSFREDLYYRVNVLHLVVPPLRERRQDIPELCEQILNKVAHRRGRQNAWRLSPNAIEALCKQEWPGNVRQLEHTLERATAYSDNSILETTDLDLVTELQNVSLKANLVGKTLREVEETLLRETLAHCQGDKDRTAKMLGVSLKTIYNKMRDFGLSM